MPNSPESGDLFFSLKGAGTSYGVVTEFLYKVYPVPETKPVLVNKQKDCFSKDDICECRFPYLWMI